MATSIITTITAKMATSGGQAGPSTQVNINYDHGYKIPDDTRPICWKESMGGAIQINHSHPPLARVLEEFRQAHYNSLHVTSDGEYKAKMVQLMEAVEACSTRLSIAEHLGSTKDIQSLSGQQAEADRKVSELMQRRFLGLNS